MADQPKHIADMPSGTSAAAAGWLLFATGAIAILVAFNMTDGVDRYSEYANYAKMNLKMMVTVTGAAMAVSGAALAASAAVINAMWQWQKRDEDRRARS